MFICFFLCLSINYVIQIKKATVMRYDVNTASSLLIFNAFPLIG